MFSCIEICILLWQNALFCSPCCVTKPIYEPVFVLEITEEFHSRNIHPHAILTMNITQIRTKRMSKPHFHPQFFTSNDQTSQCEPNKTECYPIFRAEVRLWRSEKHPEISSSQKKRHQLAQSSGFGPNFKSPKSRLNPPNAWSMELNTKMYPNPLLSNAPTIMPHSPNCTRHQSKSNK